MLVVFLVAFLSIAWVAFWPFFRHMERGGVRDASTLDYIDYKGYPVVLQKGYYTNYYTNYPLYPYALLARLNLFSVKEGF